MRVRVVMVFLALLVMMSSACRNPNCDGEGDFDEGSGDLCDDGDMVGFDVNGVGWVVIIGGAVLVVVGYLNDRQKPGSGT